MKISLLCFWFVVFIPEYPLEEVYRRKRNMVTEKYSVLGQRQPFCLCSAWHDFCICTLVAIICLVMNVETTVGEQMVSVLVWIFFQPRFCLSLRADSVAHLLSTLNHWIIFNNSKTYIKYNSGQHGKLDNIKFPKEKKNQKTNQTTTKPQSYFCNIISFLMYLSWSL